MLYTYNTAGRRTPLILTHGMYGFLPYRRARALADFLGQDQPVYGLEAPGFDGKSAPNTTVQDATRGYLAEIRRAGAKPPFVVAGVCAGSLVAFQIAQQLALEAQFASGGVPPPVLMMVDPPGIPGEGVAAEKLTPQVVNLLREQVRNWFVSSRGRTEELPFDIDDPEQFDRAVEVALTTELSFNRFFAAPYHGRVEILAIEQQAELLRRRNWPWQKVLAGPWNLTTIGCTHSDLFTSQSTEVFAWMSKCIDEALASAPQQA
ncbi:MAG TPA: alpha/beta fold hydrolase [Stellaceae bacterium]|nr:alpha/beta fold hydrolase [Stellaceae bacterium]